MTQPAAHWEKVGRYLAGELPANEAAEVRQWLEQHRSDAEFVALVERMATERRMPAAAVESALRAVKSRRAPARRVRWGTRPSWTTRLEVLAAAAAIVIAAGVFGYRALSPQAGPEVAYQTGVGQRDSVQLEDGTMVLLAPDSRIVVRGREVELTGTGYFRVVHDEDHPFTVRASGAIIRDIGTEFSVQSHGTDSAVRVVVSEGIVALSRGQEEVTLERGDVGRATTGRIEARRGAATPEDLAWTRGQLAFRDAPLAAVAMDLRRWYGVVMRVTDTTLESRHFTGSFTTESRAAALDVLALALGASFELRGDTAYFSPAIPAK